MIKKHLTGTVPANKEHLTGTVPVNKVHLTGALSTFKKLLKKNIADFWQSKLRVRSKELSSLRYFNSDFTSLFSPHPLLSTASHSYDVNKMIVQLRMVSGR